METALHTVLALIAFAANSVLCRIALGSSAIDAASFSTIRLVSGAVTLWIILSLRKEWRFSRLPGNWVSAIMLFFYAVCFSFAYLSLGVGTGALILFGAVQATMIGAAFWSRERPSLFEWMGILLALAGLVYLVFPGLKAPSTGGSALMAVAGISWGVYSLRGRVEANALASTTGNFVRSAPFAITVTVVAGSLSATHASLIGVLLAVVSGSVASGVGYVIWYSALRGLTAIRAAAVQLSVPVLAALAGLLFLSEELSIRLSLSAMMILGGIGIALAGRTQQSVKSRAV